MIFLVSFCLFGSAANAANEWSVKYKVHMQDTGWSDWESDGEISGTTGQSRRLEAISSPAAVEYYFGMKIWDKLIPVSNSLLETIPNGGVVNLPDGALLKAPNDATVYLFENGKRRVIPGAGIFEALYGSEGWDKIVTIGAPSLNAISIGVPVQ